MIFIPEGIIKAYRIFQFCYRNVYNNVYIGTFVIRNTYTFTPVLCQLDLQDYSVLYNDVVRPVICEGWHFTLM